MAVDLKRLRELPWHATVWPQLQSLQARHHAILLHGQAGIGKKGLALDLAAALLCAAPRGDGHACGSCAECAFFETRNHPDLALGASPRGSLALYRASQARAAIAGRDFVLPDDVQAIAPLALPHRCIVRPESALRGHTTDEIISQIVETTPLDLGAIDE